MPFKDLLKRKEKIDNTPAEPPPSSPPLPQASEFKFMRTDTNVEEEISPPGFEGDEPEPEPASPVTPKRGLGRFRKDSETSPSSPSSRKDHRRLSHRLHLSSKSRTSSSSSVNIPSDLPEIDSTYKDQADRQETEAQWEERATRLARENKTNSNRPATTQMASTTLTSADMSPPPGRPRSVSDVQADVDIQEAIRLHESGDLPAATDMFCRLAERGNVLSQVLYGLSLRHGWGCEPDPARAVTYLSEAASNSASIESEALKAGMKKGGAAKGELVLAIFELANCFRYGWGVKVDKVAARHYYETAANLGDTDAMNEAAWCYLDGFGGKKDKFKAAQLLRLAENSGSKTLGNTWIWKEKYNPPK